MEAHNAEHELAPRPSARYLPRPATSENTESAIARCTHALLSALETITARIREYYEWPNPEAVRPHRGFRTERYKLIHYVSELQEFELYDLHADPGETTTIYGRADVAALQQELLARLDTLQQKVPVAAKFASTQTSA